MKSIQSANGEISRTTIQAKGNFRCDENEIVIAFYDTNTSTNTQIRITNDTEVCISREGSLTSQMMIAVDKTIPFSYTTDAGTLQMETHGKSVRTNLNQNGGHLHLNYAICMNGDILTINVIELDITLNVSRLPDVTA